MTKIKNKLITMYILEVQNNIFMYQINQFWRQNVVWCRVIIIINRSRLILWKPAVMQKYSSLHRGFLVY